MAMLDVHEVSADLPRNLCRADITSNEVLDFSVSKYLRIGRHVEFSVQNRMPIRHPRFQPRLFIRFAKPPRVRELEADHQVVAGSVNFAVAANEIFTQRHKVGLILLANNELVWIGTPVGSHCHRFAAIDKLRAAFAKPLPAPQHFLCRAASRRAIPAFHWLNSPAIANLLAVYAHTFDGPAQRRLLASENCIVARKAQPERPQVAAKGIYAFERSNPGQFKRFTHSKPLKNVRYFSPFVCRSIINASSRK